jgi:large subunit ribosomal protein L18
VRGTAERPRISVFRSNRGIFASSSTTTRAARWPPSTGRRRSAPPQADGAGDAAGVCWPSARRPPAVESAVFDRGGYRYHGRVKALAEGAREGGLTF